MFIECKQFLPRNLENRKETVGIDWLREMAVKEDEENEESKTVMVGGPHGPTLARAGGRVVRGGRRLELLQKWLPRCPG